MGEGRAEEEAGRRRWGDEPRDDGRAGWIKMRHERSAREDDGRPSGALPAHTTSTRRRRRVEVAMRARAGEGAGGLGYLHCASFGLVRADAIPLLSSCPRQEPRALLDRETLRDDKRVSWVRPYKTTDPAPPRRRDVAGILGPTSETSQLLHHPPILRLPASHLQAGPDSPPSHALSPSTRPLRHFRPPDPGLPPARVLAGIRGHDHLPLLHPIAYIEHRLEQSQRRQAWQKPAGRVKDRFRQAGGQFSVLAALLDEPPIANSGGPSGIVAPTVRQS